MARTFEWTEQKRQAVALVFGGLSVRKAGEQLGISPRTIEGWLRRQPVRHELVARRVAAADRMAAEWREKLPQMIQDHYNVPPEQRCTTEAFYAWQDACRAARTAGTPPPAPPFPDCR